MKEIKREVEWYSKEVNANLLLKETLITDYRWV